MVGALAEPLQRACTCPALIVPLGLLLVGVVFFRVTEADLVLSRPFYGGAKEAWPLLHAQPWKGFYCLGCLPGLVLGIGGLALSLMGSFWSRLRGWRRAGLFLGTFLLIGPGLLVNLAIKPQWSRPRPHQVTAFGGDREYLAVGRMGDYEDSRSFPSGHAAMGFFLMAPAFLLYPRHRRLALVFMLLGLGGGAVMGLTRIVQGRHFASDVLASAAVIYFTGLLLYFLFRLGESSKPGEETSPRQETPQSDHDLAHAA